MSMSRPPARLRCLHILDNLGMGGAEAWLMALLRYWRAGGPDAPEIDFLATGGRPSVFDDEARSLGAQIRYARYGRSNVASFTRGFRRLLRDGGYDAIHDHSDQASGWHFLLGSGVLPPVRVTHVHNTVYQTSNRYGVTMRRKLTANSAKRSSHSLPVTS